MSKKHIVPLEFPSKIEVRASLSRRKIVGIGNFPYVPTVSLYLSMSSKASQSQLTIPQAEELIVALQNSISESNDLANERNTSAAT